MITPFFALVYAAVVSAAGSALTAISVNGGPWDTTSTRPSPAGGPPVLNVLAPEIICGYNGTIPVKGVTTVVGGKSNVTVLWSPDSHIGPNLIYVAPVPSPYITPVTGLKWTKISQQGISIPGGGGTGWSSPLPGGQYHFIIPPTLPPGPYLLRAESLVLPNGGNFKTAESFVGCIQINVTLTPPGPPPSIAVPFPGAYSPGDPGLTWNLAAPPPPPYPFPGGPVWPSGATTNDNDVGDI
ncbi:hypothetical protein SISSUDRAFT_1061768 [Sistotremastrum suecicum HHB10207 ss-3]|uniref:AA9 family lytic polysaccharide monooxygenase n=1 Tax=Sistotremastrum suecicum HHB10207 ss-3 TaxID=1314776 RepID=A0A166DNR4_9AGAM|nr:hypothetical protein SISSUDRAFT_1061768 [Sistotremastrum suecicum HHB10207 ss-3]